MLKRVLMLALAAGVLATLHAATAEAGWQYARPPGLWVWYSSINVCGTVTQIRNPEQHPAQLRCEVAISTVESLCENPNNHDVRPGEAATQVVLVGTNQIDNADLNNKGQKTKNTADLCIVIDDDNCDPDLGPVSPLCRDEYCVNPNWDIIDVLATAFQVTCTTEQCTGADPNNPCLVTVERDRQVCECTLPAEYSVENKPDECTDPLGVGCVAYDCFEVVNGVTTTNRCELPQ